MKKIIALILTLACALTLGACSSNTDSKSDEKTLTVSCTLSPHCQILEFTKDIFEKDYGLTLEIIELDDYYIFNKALDAGEVDANFFQHVPFFNGEVAANGYNISNVAGIHIEPFGFYSKTIDSVDAIPDGAEVILSNSVADHGRILAILEKAGLITLATDVDRQNATVEDIIANSKNLTFTEVKPEMLTTVFEQGEGDLVAINGNYAISAGLNPVEDTVILEQADATNPYVNIVACQKGHEKDAKIVALVEVLKSEAVKNYIKETWSDGSVIPAE